MADVTHYAELLQGLKEVQESQKKLYDTIVGDLHNKGLITKIDEALTFKRVAIKWAIGLAIPVYGTLVGAVVSWVIK